jgi:phosphoribosylformylglycinamidine synthase subunit PurQ / glutaminase
MKPKALVLQAHGSNRDLDVMEALALVGADATGIPLNELRMNKTLLSDFQLLVLPGGFSYADALGAGKLLALDLASYFVDEISAFIESNKPVIGICNGFQALVKSGILPGDNVIARTREATTEQSPNESNASEHEEISSGYRPRNDGVTLTFNAQGHFECRWVTLKPVSQKCIWTQGLDALMECPVAHGEGNFQTSPRFSLSSFIEDDQIALIYTHSNGSPANGEYPINPNGSVHDIAGICNPHGNVLGLMPHAENHIHPFQHPLWTRGISRNCGRVLFENGVRYARGI